MLHLSKKIYLDYVDYFNYQSDSFVVQDGDWNHSVYDETYGEIVTNTKSKVWGVVKTAEELFAKTGDFASFVKKFSGSKGDGKLVIYCDEKAFQKIAICWWKGMLPHASKDDLYNLFLEFKNNKLNSTAIVKGDKTRSQCAHGRYYNLDKKSFDALYDAIPKLKGITPEMAGVEFQLASYLYKPEGPWTAFLFRKVEEAYLQVFYYQLMSLKVEVEERLLTLHELYPEKFSRPAFEMTTEEIKEVTGFSFIGDYRFNNEVWMTDYVDRTYGLESLCKTLLDFYVRSLNASFPQPKFEYGDMAFTDARYLHLFAETSSMLTPADAIEEEADSKTEDQLFKHLTRKDKANEYLLLKTLRLAKLGRKDELKKYYLGE